MKLYYKKKLKTIVDDDWKQYIAANPNMDKIPGLALKYCNKAIRKLFECKDDEVKAEVKKRREEGGFSKEENIEPDDDDAVDATELRCRAKALSLQRKVFPHF